MPIDMLRERPFNFYGGGGVEITLVLGFFFFVRRSLAFYFCLVRSWIFSARIMRIKTKKVYYISVDSDLEMDTRLIKCLAL